MSSWWNNVLPGLQRRREALAKEAEALRNARKKEDDNEPALWVKCPATNDLIHKDELEAAHWVTPAGFHMRIGPAPRFKSMFDEGAYTEIVLPKVWEDPLKFRQGSTTDEISAEGGDQKPRNQARYADKLLSERKKLGRPDCMAAASGEIGGHGAVVLVQDFAFMGGSLGIAAGEAFLTAAADAVKRRSAFVVVTASGGARMQEGVLSLMQMPRTTLAIQDVKEAGLPYIVILTDPTSGGVTASYAMLGDIQIAEPQAMIAFSGPRVIEQTIRQKLPDGLQKAEYLLEKGMVDMICDRRQMRIVLGQILSVLMPANAMGLDDSEPELPLPMPEPAPAPTKRADRANTRQRPRAAE
jgi:acetyl-CoA carboxylase carboxyl transferase subunit beta